MTASLSKTGARQLAEAEAVIEHGLGTFMEVGAALLAIRDARLYREDFQTFEAYLGHRWGMSRRRAYQLMAAAEVGTIVHIANEAQARALAPLGGDEAAILEAWARAAAEGPVTAESLTAAVQSITKTNVIEATATTVAPEDVSPDNDDENVEDAGQDEPPASSTSDESGGAPEGTSQEDGEGQAAAPTTAPTSVTPPDSPPPTQERDPALLSMADLSNHRAAVAKWLAFDRHEQVIDGMTKQEQDDYRSFCLSVFKHASATIDRLNGPAHLKAVN